MEGIVECFLFFASHRAFTAQAVCMQNISFPMLDLLGILDQHSPPWAISDLFKPSSTISDHPGPFKTILDHLRPS